MSQNAGGLTLSELGLSSIGKVSHKSKTKKLVKALARYHSYQVAVADVESFDHHSGHTCDLFGIIDLLAIQGDYCRGIQVTAGRGDVAKHITKFREERPESCRMWLSSKFRTLEIWSWRKVKGVKGDGRRSKVEVWAPRVQLVSQTFLDGAEQADFIDVLSEPFMPSTKVKKIKKSRSIAPVDFTPVNVENLALVEF